MKNIELKQMEDYPTLAEAVAANPPAVTIAYDQVKKMLDDSGFKDSKALLVSIPDELAARFAAEDAATSVDVLNAAKKTLPILKEFLTSEVGQAAMAAEGLQVDDAAIQAVEEEIETAELALSECGCDACIEGSQEADDFAMLFDMYMRLQDKFDALEARIAAFNLKASHKI